MAYIYDLRSTPVYWSLPIDAHCPCLVSSLWTWASLSRFCYLLFVPAKWGIAGEHKGTLARERQDILSVIIAIRRSPDSMQHTLPQEYENLATWLLNCASVFLWAYEEGSVLLQGLSIGQTLVEIFCVSRAKITKSLDTQNTAYFPVRFLPGNKRVHKKNDSRSRL